MNLAPTTAGKTSTPRTPRPKTPVPFNTPGLTLIEEYQLLHQLNDSNVILAQLVELMRSTPDRHAMVTRLILENEAMIARVRPMLPARY